jgi:hypothetical protein
MPHMALEQRTRLLRICSNLISRYCVCGDTSPTCNLALLQGISFLRLLLFPIQVLWDGICILQFLYPLPCTTLHLTSIILFSHGEPFDAVGHVIFLIYCFDSLVQGLKNHSGYWHWILVLLSINIRSVVSHLLISYWFTKAFKSVLSTSILKRFQNI